MVTSSKLYVFILRQKNLKKAKKTAFTWEYIVKKYIVEISRRSDENRMSYEFTQF